LNSKYLKLPIHNVTVDVHPPLGKLECWRHSVGQGGVNPLPLPPKVIEGVKKLRPRLVRVFIQEFFFIYPDHNKFDWDRLDTFLESFAATGASIVAAITIKPKVLFPEVDATLWQPNNPDEWQMVIYELVKRYSVDKPYITYWEIGNETEIGEQGGCPYWIKSPKDYVEFYRLTADAIRKASPLVKIGGPAACWLDNNPIPALIEYCRETVYPLDFLSFHFYSNDPSWVLHWIHTIEGLLLDWPGEKPELLVTEWNLDFYQHRDQFNHRYQRIGRDISVVEMYTEPIRAAIVAVMTLTMLDTSLSGSFLYSIWDQTLYPETWRPWFSPEGVRILTERCNDLPLRLNLFGYNAEVSPPYYFYRMLDRMGDIRLKAQSDHPDICVLASQRVDGHSVLLVNYNLERSHDAIVEVTFDQLEPGSKRLTVYRIDDDQQWDDETFELIAIETRHTYTLENFCTQVYMPENSVALIILAEAINPLLPRNEEEQQK
jgi:xylan 1,4-beta-xylosidase